MVHKMEAYSDCSSTQFKQYAAIKLLIAEGITPIDISPSIVIASAWMYAHAPSYEYPYVYYPFQSIQNIYVKATKF